MITNRKESVTMRLDNYMLFLERFAAENKVWATAIFPARRSTGRIGGKIRISNMQFRSMQVYGVLFTQTWKTMFFWKTMFSKNQFFEKQS